MVTYGSIGSKLDSILHPIDQHSKMHSAITPLIDVILANWSLLTNAYHRQYTALWLCNMPSMDGAIAWHLFKATCI